MAYDFDNLYNLWRDGQLISSDGFDLRAETTNTRPIIGDGCTSANHLDAYSLSEDGKD